MRALVRDLGVYYGGQSQAEVTHPAVKQVQL